ncbi:MAG: 50S ribosomal protein L3 [Patescibacteria group bacterium]
MKFIIGTKEKMTQVFSEDGSVIPVTIINTYPLIAVQKKSKENDGYESIQFGFGDKDIKKMRKPQQGHLKKTGLQERGFRGFKELRGRASEFKIGDKIDISIFKEGDRVKITGISKGKGFQGVVKRHGFKGGPRTHGQKHSEREPGSIGATGPQRVFKGLKMAGRMGGNKVTLNNLKVMKIDKENNQIYVSGAVPGAKGTLLEIQGIES